MQHEDKRLRFASVDKDALMQEMLEETRRAKLLQKGILPRRVNRILEKGQRKLGMRGMAA